MAANFFLFEPKQGKGLRKMHFSDKFPQHNSKNQTLFKSLCLKKVENVIWHIIYDIYWSH
jgi:hypothetical protein